jgi:hypothetical protein
MTARPIRVQLRRVKGWRLPPNTVSVARPARWGNPHRIGLCPVCGAEHTRHEAVVEFRAELDPIWEDLVRLDLRGKNLACWCRLEDECHADVLLEIANREAKP